MNTSMFGKSIRSEVKMEKTEQSSSREERQPLVPDLIRLAGEAIFSGGSALDLVDCLLHKRKDVFMSE